MIAAVGAGHFVRVFDSRKAVGDCSDDELWHAAIDDRRSGSAFGLELEFASPTWLCLWLERSPLFACGNENPALATAHAIVGYLSAAGWPAPLCFVSLWGAILFWRGSVPVGTGAVRSVRDRLEHSFGNAKVRWHAGDGQAGLELPLMGLRYASPSPGARSRPSRPNRCLRPARW